MNRRQVIATFVASVAVFQGKRILQANSEPSDFAERSFLNGEAEADLRSITVRVSSWPSEDAAESARQEAIEHAGSNLPEGEFYQSDPFSYLPSPDLGAYSPDVVGWNTIVGVAAYRTEWMLLAVRRETMTLVIRVSGAESMPVLDLARELALELLSREPASDNDLQGYLPEESDVPEGFDLVYQSSPHGTVDANGTPIPKPTSV